MKVVNIRAAALLLVMLFAVSGCGSNYHREEAGAVMQAAESDPEEENSMMQTKCKTILFFGDSNTYGYDPRNFGGGRYPASVRWPDRLAASLEDGWQIIAMGQNGRCIPQLPADRTWLDAMLERPEEWGECLWDMNERLEESVEGTDEAKKNKVNVLACMLGTNDVWLTNHPDAGVAEERMKAFVEYLQEKKNIGEILLIAPPAPAAEGIADPAYAAFREEALKLPALYREIAEEKGILFVDANAWNISMGADGAHFSEEGHRAFAEKMETYLKERS